MGVDPDRSVLQPARDAQRARDVPGPHRGRQAVVDIVRPGHGLVLVGEALNGDDRPEDLPLHDLGLLVDVGDDRRLVVITRSRDLLAADEDLGPGILRAVDEALHAFTLFGRDQRSHLDLGVGDVADLDRLDGGHQSGEELVVDPGTGDDTA